MPPQPSPAQAEVEHALRTLSDHGQFLDPDPTRQLWRFEIANTPRHLAFYPRRSRLTRFFRGDPAMQEFLRLQWLQKANIPAPRAIAVLKGFRLNNQQGDALLLDTPEPSTPVDQALLPGGPGSVRASSVGQTFLSAMDGGTPPSIDSRQRHHLHLQLISLLQSLAKSGLTHTHLTLSSLLFHNNELLLTDARHIQRRPLALKHLYPLHHSASPHATRTEILRTWFALTPPQTYIPLPPRNPLSPKLWRQSSRLSQGHPPHFTKLSSSGWEGLAYEQSPRPYAWSHLSHLTFTRDDLDQIWQQLLHRITTHQQIQTLKQDASGQVLSTTLTHHNSPLHLVVKLPARKQWHRYLTDPLRGDRASRAWTRAWQLVARDIPTAWPLMAMRRRNPLGYVLESALVLEHIPGQPLAHTDFNSLPPETRDLLFRRTGRLLRRIDDTGFYHRDSKSDNVMVTPDNTPLLVDLDGIRSPTFGRWSLPRMLRSLKLHKQYTPQDSLSLCQGYAPFAHIEPER